MNKALLNKANEVLTTKELGIFKLMFPQSGVPFLKGKPGIGKSAIVNSISKKLGMNYIDLRLSQLDETDLGLFPTTKQNASGNTYVEYAIPHWAILANEGPTIIHFEELNRSSLPIRNAALQILNERGIGYKFRFNSDVYMIASGNQGDADGTEVEEFDNALKTRLLTRHYDLTLQEWIDGFARENVNPLVVDYLNTKPAEFYKFNEETEAYATPRGWTFLSDYINAVVENPNDVRQVLSEVSDKVGMYVGASGTGFVRFLNDRSQVSVEDLLNNYNKVAKTIENIGNVKKTELIEDLKQFKFEDLTKKQITNIHSFLKTVEMDQLAGYLTHLIDNQNLNDENKAFTEFVLNYDELLNKILEETENN